MNYALLHLNDLRVQKYQTEQELCEAAQREDDANAPLQCYIYSGTQGCWSCFTPKGFRP